MSADSITPVVRGIFAPDAEKIQRYKSLWRSPISQIKLKLTNECQTHFSKDKLINDLQLGLKSNPVADCWHGGDKNGEFLTGA